MFQARQFLQESLQRLKTKSPKYFFYVQLIFGALALLSFLPSVLHDYFGIILSEKLAGLCTKIGFFFSGMAASATLPANDTKDMPLSGQKKQ